MHPFFTFYDTCIIKKEWYMFWKYLVIFFVCSTTICGIKKGKVYIFKVSWIFSGNKIYLLYRLSPKIEMFDKQTILIGGFWQFANNIAYEYHAR